MNRKNIFLVMSSLFIFNMIFAQTPVTDPHWQLKWEDEFNGTLVNTTKWDFMPDWGYCGYIERNTIPPPLGNGTNHIVSDGTIKLITKKETSICTEWNGDTSTKHYTTGVLVSREAWKYGFFEIRCRIPELHDTSCTGEGFLTCFWLWPYTPGALHGEVTWSEIDVFEIHGKYGNNHNFHTCNAHYCDTFHKPCDPPYWNVPDDEHRFSIDFTDFHKFSCAWTPSDISFYFDDKLLRRVNSEFASKLITMNFIINISTPKNLNDSVFVTFPPNALFPYTYEIDYVRVHQLQCDKRTIVNEISNFNTYNYAVKKSISMSNATTIPANNNISLRASDFIELKAGFEVPLGSELYLDITSCEEMNPLPPVIIPPIKYK